MSRWGAGHVDVPPCGVLARDIPIELEGARNFRDLGGLRTVDGLTVRQGLVFRADAPHALTEPDLARCTELGLRTAFDLRSPREREAERSRLTALPGIRIVEVPLLSESRPDVDPAEGGEAFLLAIYRKLLTESAATIGRILTEMAAHGSLPAVFHCSAGKDRTGVVGAVLLLALGVDLEDVLDDYELTSRYRSEERVRELVATLGAAGMPPELAAGLMGTPRWVLRQALEDGLGAAPDADAASTYLVGPGRMEPGALAQLCDELTVQQ